MSTQSWQDSLQQSLQTTLSKPEARIAIVGIGHDLRGDDAVGSVIAYELQIRLASSEGLLVLNAGCAPENYLGTLIRFAPDLLLLIDAANLGSPPGTIRLLDPLLAEGCSSSTHSLSLSMLTRYLREELGCEMLLLGIQPESLFFGQALTARLDQCADEIVAVFCNALLASA